MKPTIIILVGALLVLLFWTTTGRVRTVRIKGDSPTCEQVALDLLIDSIESTLWLERNYYEVHVLSNRCHIVYNYYPKKDLLSTANDPCSGFGGRFWLTKYELIELKNKNLEHTELVLKQRRPPFDFAYDVPNSLCDFF